MTTHSNRRLASGLFAASIFLSAFLLFQVQPLISKTILPWFGGSPAVWTTCMLFFQTVLFAGYAYAHLLANHFTGKTQFVIHCGLLAAAALLLPIVPDPGWKPTGGEQPTFRILCLLGATIGLPYFVLSATGPLLQNWFGRAVPDASPYRLYALSNAGSLLALLSYPFFVEPVWSSGTQAVYWSTGFTVFAVLCACCAATVARFGSRAPHEQPTAAPSPPPEPRKYLLWLVFAAIPSVMLLATTNQVCLDVATVPFLWIVPLSLYLMSFILTFESERWYSRRLFGLLLVVSLVGVVQIMLRGAAVSILLQVTVYFSALFFCCMVCHGELIRVKPDPRYLTAFYLVIAAGGASGGLFVGLVAPAIFPTYLEMHVGILACTVVAGTIFARDRIFVTDLNVKIGWTCAAVFLIGAVLVLKSQAENSLFAAVDVRRNFYGVLRVEEEAAHDPTLHRRGLFHGSILHGFQFLDPLKRDLPTAYYSADSGVARAILATRNADPQRIGVVGLGVGTLATYGRTGDEYVFYEINSDVVQLADRHFTYLSDSDAQTDVVIGDARLALEQSSPQHFDVLVLDAFSGDAIPVHLLTTQAARIWLRHLELDGVLAVHISNLHFDLRPVIAGLAKTYGLHALLLTSEENRSLGAAASHWVLLSRVPFDEPLLKRGKELDEATSIVWTDDFSNLLSVLR